LEPLAAAICEAARLADVLLAIKDGATSFSDNATALGWYDRLNELDRSKVQRTIGRLKRAKLVAVVRDRQGYGLIVAMTVLAIEIDWLMADRAKYVFVAPTSQSVCAVRRGRG
jgi:hypothetical protein